MKQIIWANSIELAGEEFTINVQPEYGQGCFKPILARIQECMTALLSYHSKIFVVQFVVHLHEFTPTNMQISRLMDTIRKKLKRHYSLPRVITGWVRESVSSQKQHYHVVVMLDGNRVIRQGTVMRLVQEILEVKGLPRASFNTKTHTVRRDDRAAFHSAFYHLSYMAKIATKGNRPKATNDYSFSRLQIKPRNSKNGPSSRTLQAAQSRAALAHDVEPVVAGITAFQMHKPRTIDQRTMVETSRTV